MDTSAILGFITDFQTAGVAVAIALTVAIFAVKAGKWLRRAG